MALVVRSGVRSTSGGADVQIMNTGNKANSGRKTYVSCRQHQEEVPPPHDSVVPSVAQRVEPDQQTSRASQQYSTPVLLSRAQALGGLH